MGDVDQVRAAAAAMMPTIKEALDQMVAVPSVAFPGYPPEPVHEMADTVLGLFQAVGHHERGAPGGARRVPADLRRARGAARVTGGDALRALRRAAGAARAGLDLRSVDPDAEGRRPGLRTRRGRRQGRARDPPRHAPVLRWLAAVHDQADRRGDGGDVVEPRAVRRGTPRPVRVRPVRRVRHGQPRGRGAHADDDPARRRRVRRDREARSSTRCTRASSAVPCPTR